MRANCFRTVSFLSLAFAFVVARHLSMAAEQPPAGFMALFNQQDLAGWWGADTEDPRKYMALPLEQFKEKHDNSLQDIRRHWSVENGELVNDGKGLYLTTDK